MAADLVGKVRFDDVHGRHLLVALSGGADSVALLMLLHLRRADFNLRITAAHYHHGIRGPQADEDAHFCRCLCKSLGIHLIEGRGDVPQAAAKMHAGLETTARELRYAFLRSAQQQCSADAIALAHHLDDQAETVLMHLLRGTGPEGICGMARLKNGLYRPLLEISKAELVQFLRERGISWREDATNAVSDNPRNALRLHALPGIERNYPQAARAIARYAQSARIESDYMARQTEIFLAERLESGPYGKRLLLRGDEEEALLRRALRRLCGPIPMEKTDAAMAIARSNRGKMEISAGLQLEKTPSALYFLPPAFEKNAPVSLRIPGETLLPGICRILAEEGDFPPEPENKLSEVFDAEALTGAQLRTRQSGDRIHPLGAPGERLLSDYLTDKKIDRPLRECMPVVAVGKNVIWAGGAGIAHSARITDETLRTVRLTIIPITDEKAEVYSL